jgi:Ca2+-binding EF-hand superfamily protein
MGFSLA